MKHFTLEVSFVVRSRNTAALGSFSFLPFFKSFFLQICCFGLFLSARLSKSGCSRCCLHAEAQHLKFILSGCLAERLEPATHSVQVFCGVVLFPW